MQFAITQALVDECLAIPFNDTNSTNCVVATAMAREMNLPVGQVDCGYTLASVLSGEHKGLYKLSDNAANIVKGFDSARGAKFRNATIPAVQLGVIEYTRCGD